MDKSIINRIQKLLALAAKDSGATESEANSAMEKAQAIMSEHNLTMATIAATGKAGTEARTKEGLDGQAMFDYQRDLMSAIAETNYCYVSIIYSHKGRSTKAIGYRLIGTESNVMTTKVMFEYLMQTINRLVLIEVNNDYRQRMSRYAISWCTGCANRLRDRIKERHDNYLADQKKEADQTRKAAQHPASPSHGALVVVMEDYAQKERDLNEDFRMGREPGATARLRSERDAKEKERRQKKIAEALAAGFSQEVAEAFAGYLFDSLQEAHDWVHGIEKEKTEAEKAKEAKEDERWYRRQQSREEKALAKRDWSAYAKGSNAGSSISLDRQVGQDQAVKQIK